MCCHTVDCVVVLNSVNMVPTGCAVCVCVCVCMWKVCVYTMMFMLH